MLYRETFLVFIDSQGRCSDAYLQGDVQGGSYAQRSQAVVHVGPMLRLLLFQYQSREYAPYTIQPFDNEAVTHLSKLWTGAFGVKAHVPPSELRGLEPYT